MVATCLVQNLFHIVDFKLHLEFGINDYCIKYCECVCFSIRFSMELFPFGEKFLTNCNLQNSVCDSPSLNTWLYNIMIHRY